MEAERDKITDNLKNNKLSTAGKWEGDGDDKKNVTESKMERSNTLN